MAASTLACRPSFLPSFLPVSGLLSRTRLGSGTLEALLRSQALQCQQVGVAQLSKAKRGHESTSQTVRKGEKMGKQYRIPRLVLNYGSERKERQEGPRTHGEGDQASRPGAR